MTPLVLDEFETIEEILLKRRSLARLGDGELKNARDADCKLQRAHPALARRLREVLASDDERVLVGIPRIWGVELPEAKAAFWAKWRQPKEMLFYRPGRVYYSAFVSRPDSAPWIDCEPYWRMVRSIWDERPVQLVTGSQKGLALRDCGMLDNTLGVEAVLALERHAWSEYSSLLRHAAHWCERHPDGVTVISLGPTATVLAYDLGREGHQALDFGHMGMFAAASAEARQATADA